jgi:hypothetical protein
MPDFIYLASQSPRRRQLLEQLGVRNELLLPNVDGDVAEDAEGIEAVLPGESPDDYVPASRPEARRRCGPVRAARASLWARRGRMAFRAGRHAFMAGRTVLTAGSYSGIMGLPMYETLQPKGGGVRCAQLRLFRLIRASWACRCTRPLRAIGFSV